MFEPHSIESAPAAAKPMLEGAKQALGFVPNLYANFAESPELLEAYTTIGAIFDRTPLTPTERQIILLTVSFQNNCDYCMAAHSTIAGMQQVDGHIVTALRDGTPLTNPKLEALRTFTAQVVEGRGWVKPADAVALVAAGYPKRTVLDVILAVGMKTLSNYTNHIARTPLDHAFEPRAWTRP
jgi:uncharacterized peroxidase-related enzyme